MCPDDVDDNEEQVRLTLPDLGLDVAVVCEAVNVLFGGDAEVEAHLSAQTEDDARMRRLDQVWSSFSDDRVL